MTEILQFKRPTKPTALELTREETKVWNILSSTAGDAAWLGETFDVSPQTIRNIKMLKTNRARGVHAKMLQAGVQAHIWEPAPRFADEEVSEIRTSTETSVKLAKRFECSPSTIRMVRTGKTYAD